MNFHALMVSSATLLASINGSEVLDSPMNPFFGERPDSATIQHVDYNERDVDCMAKNIYFEARGEPLDGQRAVGLVTLNRARNPNFPRSICGVVFQAERNRHGAPIRNRCQFSWYCDGIPDRIRDRESFAKSMMVARDVLENQVDNTTGGAINYHEESVHPNWNMTETSHIGNHIFYASAR